MPPENQFLQMPPPQLGPIAPQPEPIGQEPNLLQIATREGGGFGTGPTMMNPTQESQELDPFDFWKVPIGPDDDTPLVRTRQRQFMREFTDLFHRRKGGWSTMEEYVSDISALADASDVNMYNFIRQQAIKAMPPELKKRMQLRDQQTQAEEQANFARGRMEEYNQELMARAEASGYPPELVPQYGINPMTQQPEVANHFAIQAFQMKEREREAQLRKDASDELKFGKLLEQQEDQVSDAIELADSIRGLGVTSEGVEGTEATVRSKEGPSRLGNVEKGEPEKEILKSRQIVVFDRGSMLDKSRVAKPITVPMEQFEANPEKYATISEAREFIRTGQMPAGTSPASPEQPRAIAGFAPRGS